MLSFIKKLLGIPQVDLKEVLAGDVLILDVRSPAEFKSGHVKGAMNIPLDRIDGKIDVIKKKNQVVVAYCKSGMRSRMAISKLKSNGIEAYNGVNTSKINQLLS